MKKILYSLFTLILLGAAFVAGLSYNRQEPTRADSPRAPAASSDSRDGSLDSDQDPSMFPPGTVRILSEKQQAIGIRTSPVEKKPFIHNLRVLGRVAADENLVYRMTVASEGWIRRLYPLTVGSPIKKGQRLASCYSRELVILGQTYLNALALLERFPESGKADAPGQHILPRATSPRVALEIAEDGLRSLGMGEMQIEEMKRTGQLVQEVILVSLFILSTCEKECLNG